jgi:hypothetical protein
MVGGLALMLAAARADVLLQDNFDYPDGSVTVVAADRWRHHSGGAEDMQVVAGELSLSQSASEDVNALLVGQPYLPEAQATLYAAWNFQAEQLPAGVSGGYFAHFKDAANGFRGRVFVSTNGAMTGRFRLGVSASAGSASAMHPQDLQLQTSYRVVVRYEVTTAQTTLWIDPSTEEDIHALSVDDASPATITALAFRQSLSSGNGMGILGIDNLVVGQAFSDVVGGESPVPAAPEILVSPHSQTVLAGEQVQFSVVARGTEPLVYQWWFQGAVISGATNASLVLLAASPEQSGNYYVTVSNDQGATNSPEVSLTVENEPTGTAPLLGFTNILDHLVRPGDLRTNGFTEISLHPGEELTVQLWAQSTDRAPCGLRLLTENLPSTATWESLQGGGLEASGRFHYAPNRDDLGRQLFIKISAETEFASREFILNLYVPTEAEQEFILTEYLANPATDATSPIYNPLGRPEPSQRPALEDEYLEWVNYGPGELDVSGWTIEDAQQVRHVFAGESRVGSFGAMVIYGGPKDELVSSEGFQASPASEGAGGLSLNNTGTECIVLRNASHQLVARVVYTEADLSPDSALCRWPERNGPFILHSQAGALRVSPGKTPRGDRFDEIGTDPVSVGNLQIERQGKDNWQLVWEALPGLSYSVWASEQITGPYLLLVRDLCFTNSLGCMTPSLGPDTREMYYRVSSP